MAEVSAMPDYAVARVLQAAQAKFHTFVPAPGNGTMSLSVLRDLTAILDPENVDDYLVELSTFVDLHRDRLARVLTQYGDADGTFDDRYLLVTQPESLVLFDLISTKPYLLASLVTKTDLESLVRPLYTLWSVNWPLD